MLCCAGLVGSSDGHALKGQCSRLIASLEAETLANPDTPKWLIGPDVIYGRELLTALARRTGGWIGWKATSLRHIAGEIAFVPLDTAGFRVGGDVEIRVLVNRAVDRARDDGALSRDVARLAHSAGFRQALRDSVLELRMAGVSAAALDAAAHAESPARAVAAVMHRYESILAEARVADSAAVFRAALESFDDEARFCLTGQLLLSPTLVERGLPGALLERLISYGARSLDGDTAMGVVAPPNSVLLRAAPARTTAGEARSSPLAWVMAPSVPAGDDARLDIAAAAVDMFAASTPSEELREVLRRVIGEGLRWDEVEIVTTDVDAYGTVLEVLCQTPGIGGTMLQGIPLARTRPGRALERWFAWLENGLPADTLRQALESGEIGSGMDAEPTEIARALRAMRVGWGRKRYEAALERSTAETARVQIVRRSDESDAELADRVASRCRGMEALHSILDVLLSATPEVPERGSDRTVMSSASKLAGATLAWLSLVTVDGQAESQTMDRVRSRLDALVRSDDGVTSFAGSLATVRDALSDVRHWPLRAGEAQSRSASGGAVHLTDLAHAGVTGRPRTFIVGLSADALGGPDRQDPLLPDSLRAAIGGDALSSTIQRREERVFTIGAGLASLRGRVTLSYAISPSAERGEAGPAAMLLQVHRILEHDATLSYADLSRQLSPVASAVPAESTHGAGCVSLDVRDVWLDAIADGPLLLDAVSLVRQCFPLLDAGLTARDTARSPSLTAFTGHVARAAGELDPRNNTGRAISPSALELLAKCPLAWFYRYGLGLRAMDDPEYDVDAWLNPAQRGSLLHETFEAFARQFAHRRAELGGSDAGEAMIAIVEAAIARWVVDVPAPASFVFEQEAAELRRAALSFLEMERASLADGDDGKWRYFELAFGAGEQKAQYQLDDGSWLNVWGRVDRVDELGDGSLRVIDYKMRKVSVYRKDPKLGRFNGGRQLQPAMYAGVLDGLLGSTVARFEYRFPTERGRNASVAYTAAELAEARPLVTQLLEHARDGTFIPTTSREDCSYCDAGAICRVGRSRFGQVTSPRAEWAEANAEGIAAYAGMLSRRTREAR